MGGNRNSRKPPLAACAAIVPGTRSEPSAVAASSEGCQALHFRDDLAIVLLEIRNRSHLVPQGLIPAALELRLARPELGQVRRDGPYLELPAQDLSEDLKIDSLADH